MTRWVARSSTTSSDGNCAGIFLLDTGAPGAGGDVTVRDNKVHDNNARVPG